MFSQEIIQAIHAKVQIEDVIGDFITLKRRGQTLWGCCPFHHEKTPSFAVSSDKGFYKCFGCDASGDAISFIRAIEGMTFVEAVKQLANKYNIPIEESTFSYTDSMQYEKDSLYILMKFAQSYYTTNLWQHLEGKRVASTYLTQRNISQESIDQFEIGYSLNAWQSFYDYAKQKGYTDDLLLKAGLVIQSDNKTVDRFRSRIIFPIHNLSGKVIALAGRIVDTSDNKPKYINSPETPIYHKSDVLYGIHQAKNQIKKVNKCLLVEGYTDVIALHQAGITYAVASAGTALTDSQIQIISRFTKKISILFDSDAAGIKASLRGIDKILEHGLYVKIILLPAGEDPDSYVHKIGPEAFQAYIHTHEQDFITFKAKLLLKGVEDDLLHKAEVIEEILQSIVLIPDEIHRTLLLQQTSKLLEISEMALLTAHNKLLAKRTEQQRKTYDRRNPTPTLQLTAKDGIVKQTDIADIITAHEKDNIRLLLNYGNTLLQDGKPLSLYLIQELQDVTFQTSIYKEILTLYGAYIAQDQDKEVDLKLFIQHSNEQIQKTVIDLVAMPHEVSNNWQEKYQIGIIQETDNLHQTAYKNILRLKLRLIHQLVQENNQLLKNNKDPVEEDQLLYIYTQLKASEIAIAKQLGIVLF